jgi:hypothetical protein
MFKFVLSYKEFIIGLILTLSLFWPLFAIFMINPRSDFVWKVIDPLKYLQFPWRFLILIIFFISSISGSIFVLEFKKKRLIWILFIIAVVSLNFLYFRPDKFIQTTDQERLSGKDWDTQIKRSIFDYLPIYAKAPPAELATVRYKILTGDSQVYDFYEGTNWITFKTKTNTHSIIRLSQYYFPDWRIFVDGKEIVIDYKGNDLGLMTVILGKGNHEISARLYDTQIRSLGNSLTVAGFFISVVLFLVSFSGVRRWIAYYRKRVN